ncbi:MAG TPA: TetR/AcrR family transcriptional regulator [Microvirga sp.]|jgi:AcrR family transcriptional regulator
MLAVPPPSSTTGPFRFLDVLRAEAKSSEGLRKTERTRARLRLAALEVLEREGWHALSVERITDALGLARGTFYRYYSDRDAIVLDVVSAFEEALVTHAPKARRAADVYARIITFNTYYVEVFRLNADLFRAILQLRHSAPAFRSRGQQLNHQWAQRIIRSLQGQSHGASEPGLRVLIYAMQSMVDDLLKQVFIDRNAHLQDFADTPEDLARYLSVIWHRAVFAADPEGEHELPHLASTTEVPAGRSRRQAL